MKDLKNIRVLIAEDDYLVGEMIHGLLEELGYSIAGEARNGRQAVELARTLKPDVIIMDIQLPEMDGLEAARRIHEICPAPVVALTAFETPDLVEQVSRTGMGAYLVKPPNGREMERAITIAMARFHDLTEMRRLNATLQTYNEELDAFAHTVAHDLQSPLSRIIGFADLLRDGHPDTPPPKLNEYLEIISRNAHKMNTIIEELLLLAGVRETEVEIRPLNIATVILESRQRLIHQIERHQAEVILPDSWPVVLGYGPWVEAVWVNYISNGIKYGGRPPRLRLGASPEPDGMVRFWIEDNGPGLSVVDQSRLFAPFTQLDHSRSEGHGLGLSIVQRIVEKLGGSVGVESNVGQGSTFWFTLPAAQNNH